ncbi:MAG: hypothetical protein Q8R30_05310 [bacterium]|nr:hypothetical protein [bacterium]
MLDRRSSHQIAVLTFEATLGKLGRKRIVAVLAGRIKLEGHLYKWCS